MAGFPTDVVTDILSFLPVKTLVRFKCVSKPWSSLINNSDFVKLHLHHSKTNSKLKLVLDNCNEKGDDKIYSVDFDTLVNLEQLSRPFTYAGSAYSSRIFGSCNGLLAVYHRIEGIALWNPSIRTCYYVPKLDVTKDGYPLLGFGYDTINNDYKVVKMNKYGKSVMIYSLKANSWRMINDCPFRITHGPKQDGAYANGSLHWVGGKKGKSFGGKLIFGFDLGIEEFHQVPEPDNIYRNFVHKNVGCFESSSLCVFRHYRQSYHEDHVILWEMKDYGVKESWTKLFCLGQEWSKTNIFYSRAIASSKRGDRVLLDDGGCRPKPAWFNLEKRKGEILDIPGAPERFSTTIYVESCVPTFWLVLIRFNRVATNNFYLVDWTSY